MLSLSMPPRRRAPSSSSSRTVKVRAARKVRAVKGRGAGRRGRKGEGGSKGTPIGSAPTDARSGLAPGMRAINSYLAVTSVATSMTFLERAFGFTRGVVLPGPDGQLRYAEMRHGDSVIVLIPRGDQTTASGGTAGL